MVGGSPDEYVRLLDDNQQGYYGRNDLQPMSLGKKTCVYLTLIVLSPIILVLLVLGIVLSCITLAFMSVNEHQKKTAKYLAFENWYRAPGKKLEVKATGLSSSDIIIPKDFVNDDGQLDTCKHISLRKSIECTVQEHCRRGRYGAAIESNEDRDAPRYLLHGWPEPYDPNGDEMWFTHARTATWAAIYSWTGQLAAGWTDWSPLIDLKTAPDVFGYIYLFEVGNPNFYKEPRIVRVGSRAFNAPDHTPETENKIFARYDYGHVKYMGDFPQGDPDAYIFKGEKVLKEAKLKLLNRYRVIKPSSK